MGNRALASDVRARFSKGLRKTSDVFQEVVVGCGKRSKWPERALRGFSMGVHSLRQPRQIHSLLKGGGGVIRFPCHAAAARAISTRARCEAISFSLS